MIVLAFDRKKGELFRIIRHHSGQAVKQIRGWDGQIDRYLTNLRRAGIRYTVEAI